MLIRTPRDLGLAIRERRRQLAMDQQELAKKIGVSRQWVVEVEKGKARAEAGLILRALNALGISLSANQIGSADEATREDDIDRILERAKGKHS